ncbi:uncharacterized protein JCM6883_006835 [Sporobolomyces salmoneus]|uniref:uncharacterized protein n=1 Tax=Sporobolomyces salmoneus TaxID=183962 RepID=UPI00316B110D
MATYDNGLYTPWTPAGEAQPTTTMAWEAATSQSTMAWWTPSTSSAATPSTTPAPITSTSVVPTSSISSSSSSSPVSSSTLSSSSSLLSSTSSSTTSSSISSSSIRTTLSSSATHSSASGLHPSGIIAASSSSDSPPPAFKITYLLPVFVIVPCVLLFLLAAWFYGKYWAKPRSDRPQDQPGFWDSAAYKSLRRKGGGGDDQMAEDEKEGLVIGKEWAGDIESASPSKRKESKKWSNWLGRGPSTRSNGSDTSRNGLPFVSVSYASLDQPFNPPSHSTNAALARSASQMSDRGDKGWGWGKKPQAKSSALRVVNGSEHLEDDEDSQYLSAARGWNSGSTRKYRAKKNGSISSRISDKVMGRLSPGGGLSPSAIQPSPSVYSPQFSPTQDAGRYAELEGDEEELYEDDDEKKVDLDAYLGESRVGDGGMANRYLKGDASAIPPPRRVSSHQPQDEPIPSFAVNLPSAPPRTQVSPKKSQSTLLRAPPPESPRATPPPQLLFGYDSPPPPQHSRGPLPVPNSQSRSNLSSSDPFTSPPARIPFRSQPPPQLSRPSRANTGTPFSPETAPALFFTSPPLSSPPSQYPHTNVVGSPMPDFQPGALRASESAFSIAGVDKLIFSDPSAALPPSASFMNPRSESRTGLKDLVQKPKSRKEEIDQLRRSVGPQTSTIPATTSPLRPNEPQGVAGFKSITSRPIKEPRESLGFNPSFSESPTIAPLQHPSKVRAAIENLEAKSTHSKHSSIDSTRSGRSAQSSPTKPERLPSPPASQKLERSTTTLGRSRRPRGGFGSDDEDAINIEDHEDEEAIKNRRVSTLLLSRSRTQSGPSSLPASGSSHDSHSNSLEDSPEQGGAGGLGWKNASSSSSNDLYRQSVEEPYKRPLSSDPARLQQMLRRKSTGANLGTEGETGGVKVDEDGKVGGGIISAMTRRSGIFD